MINWFTIFFAIILFFAGAFLFFLRRVSEKGKIISSFDMALFLVLMPKYDFGDEDIMKRQEKELIGDMQQIFTGFLHLREPSFFKKFTSETPRVAFEIASQTGGSDIEFYVAVPRYMRSGFEKFVHGVYPRAIVEEMPQDYTIFERGGVSVGAYFKLENYPVFPINTYENLDKDPLATITNALSKIAADEGAAIQVVISPYPQKKWKNIGYNVIAKIKGGSTAEVAAAESLKSGIGGISSKKPKDNRQNFKKQSSVNIMSYIGMASPNDEQKDYRDSMTPTMPIQVVDDRTVQKIQDKFEKQVFMANIRLVASSKTKERSEEILEHLLNSFSQFSLYSLNGFEAKTVKKKGQLKKFLYNFSFRNFTPAESNILNIEELTSVYHFPTRFIETPYIRMAKATESAPPPQEISEGKQEGKFPVIGRVNFRGDDREVAFLSRNDRRRHFYVIGQTGTGKSSLLEELIRQDIQNGEGVGVVDPHGDLVEHILSNIPKERVEDVVLFEPFDGDRPMGLNMLEYETPEQKDFAVQEMVAIFQKLFPPEMIGPMFEHYMRNAMLALMADKANPGTLLEIPRMFTDSEFMEERLRRVEDPVVRNFWIKEWKQTTGNTRSDMLGYVVSKIGRFIENEMMRNIIGQQKSSFNLAQLMDEGKIFLANLSKGATGEVNSSLLGLILVSKIQMAAMRRGKIPEEQRRDFYLYLDEFQNFSTDSIATILSEARKYRLNLILAHQYIPQLEEDIKNAVLGNVGTIGAFRIGASDAEFLEKQFQPEFSRFDLVNLDNFRLVLKLMMNNKVYPPFRVETLKPKQGDPSIIEPIKKISKLKYGRPRNMVEQEIMDRFGTLLEGV
ncbi:MAG: hypothetical protein A3B96_03190 [Candidatus Spechtbacteria bacterium RIFCSPHIGHO2_02_FULL_43_15b]|uniref:Uncharacterized protein n=1 Tax=Candidatus Spechtbacteria bacterium RIFCSPHIGHO2_01_FULL_43_30 TaxID=1802158 RepID=A0A1G2H8C9_9BACT|nr:MAG: hypothetical protein A2827_00460 [Candidatus Spechtbacteria bacterium RIFCSPHIGHO2_01_FULL_43_30]OGZ59748.1 MAG: hypothetical protein A3B96_03190 [Candidatus Spechtbacteria bacterium RIFCSPHIGHO2_02_FULL_43_15b]